MTKFMAHIVASIDVEIDADDFTAAGLLADRITVAEWRIRSTWPTSHECVTTTVSQYDAKNGSGLGGDYEPVPAHPRWTGPWSVEQAVSS